MQLAGTHTTAGIRRRARLALGLCLAALVAYVPPALASRQVMFRDLRTLVVDAVEPEGEDLILRMGQGNEVRVSADAVLEIREYTPPAAPAEPDRVPNGLPAEFGPPLPTWRDRAGDLVPTIEKNARQYRLAPELIVAVALTESRFDPLALSRAGAQGVMQLMPGTARLLRVGDVWDARQNVEAGARWLRRLLDKFEDNLDLALAAYNAGEEAVKRFGGVPPYRETQQYVQRVRTLLQGFAAAS